MTMELEKSQETNTDHDSSLGNLAVLTLEQRNSFIEDGLSADNISKLEKHRKEITNKRLHSWNLFHGKFRPDGTKWPDCRPINVVLVGKTGTGLSATGNLLLGHEEFDVASLPRSVTDNVRICECTIQGRRIRVIDTPGVCHTVMSEREVRRECRKVFKMFPNGIDVFLYVHSLAGQRFSEEDKKCKQKLQGIFGKEFLKHGALILTHADTSLNDKSLHEYQCENIRFGDPLGHFIEKEVRNRVLAINNHAESDYEREALRRLMLDLLYRVMEDNEGRLYMQPTDWSRIHIGLGICAGAVVTGLFIFIIYISL